MNSDLLLSKNSAIKYKLFLHDLPQSLILVGPVGFGKKYIMQKLSEQYLGHKYFQYLSLIEPDLDKKNIRIEQIRDMKKLLKLTTNHSRIVLIPQANLLTSEAQNNLLKILEEPPQNTHFILSVSDINQLLITIRSRSYIWNLLSPTTEQIETYFKGTNKAKLDLALKIGLGNMGTITKIITSDSAHQLLQDIEIAKEILAENEIDRLINIKSLATSSEKAMDIVQAIEILCQAALYNVSLGSSARQIQAWNKRLKHTEQAIYQLNKHVQTKLVLAKLFLVL